MNVIDHSTVAVLREAITIMKGTVHPNPCESLYVRTI